MTEEQKRKRFEDALERQARIKKEIGLKLSLDFADSCVKIALFTIPFILFLLALPFFHNYF